MLITIPLSPTTNHLYATVTTATGMAIRTKSKELRGFYLLVGHACARQGVVPYPKGVRLAVTYYVYMARKSDLDNRLKACQDALKRLAWHDDIQIEEIHAYRRIDRENPRIEISIQVVE